MKSTNATPTQDKDKQNQKSGNYSRTPQNKNMDENSTMMEDRKKTMDDDMDKW